DVFAQGRVRNREHRRPGDSRVLQQDGLDLLRPDLLPTAVDDLLEAPGDEEEAVAIHVAPVTGREPPPDQGVAILDRVPGIRRDHIGSPYDDLPVFPRRDE